MCWIVVGLWGLWGVNEKCGEAREASLGCTGHVRWGIKEEPIDKGVVALFRRRGGVPMHRDFFFGLSKRGVTLLNITC